MKGSSGSDPRFSRRTRQKGGFAQGPHTLPRARPVSGRRRSVPGGAPRRRRPRTTADRAEKCSTRGSGRRARRGEAPRPDSCGPCVAPRREGLRLATRHGASRPAHPPVPSPSHPPGLHGEGRGARGEEPPPAVSRTPRRARGRAPPPEVSAEPERANRPEPHSRTPRTPSLRRRAREPTTQVTLRREV